MRILFFALLGVAVWWLIFRSRHPKRPPRETDPPSSPSPSAEVKTVACAHCGVYAPLSEMHLHQGSYYCCQAHMPSNKPADQ